MCNIAFETGAVPEVWTAVNFILYKGIGERRLNARNIEVYYFVSCVVGNVYPGVLVDRFCRMTEGLMMSRVVSDQEGDVWVEVCFKKIG